MLFNSYEFLLLFLPLTLSGIYLLTWGKQTKCTIWFAAFASLIFYASGEKYIVFILLESVIFNYLVGSAILQWQEKKNQRYANILLLIGITANLGLLGYFKYTNFFAANLENAFGWHLGIPPIALPIGISFYTFTQIGFLVDSWRGESHRYRISDYLLFVTYFPHLVAGPILNHKKIIPQFEQNRFGRPSAEALYKAAIFFSVGMFKKIIIADNLAGYVHIFFDHPDQLNIIESWMAALLYALQLYYDFSGYSEMAVGLSLLMNIEIPINFNSPYKSASIVEFWRRWHISLSLFLRDYIYIPLGGNRKGEARRYFNLVLTMFLGGLWHGAGWTFILWGTLHGCGLAINHMWQRFARPLPRVVALPFTFIFVIFGWVLFRSPNLHAAGQLFSAMLGGHAIPNIFHGADPSSLVHHVSSSLCWIALLLLWCFAAPNTQQFAEKPRWYVAVIAACMLAASFMSIDSASDFLYFKF